MSERSYATLLFLFKNAGASLSLWYGFQLHDVVRAFSGSEEVVQRFLD